MPDIAFPYYPRVPKELRANLAFRRKLLDYGYAGQAQARELWIACSRDLLFYVNGFVWTINPKLETRRVLPFITWKYQDAAFAEIAGAVAHHDLHIEKSRDMGASWKCLLVFDWFYRFHQDCSFMVMSRKEGLVDSTENPDTLFSKLDYVEKHLPAWLRPRERIRQHMMVANKDLGNVIDGEPTTGDAGRGGRRTAILCDEFAAVDTERPGRGQAVLAATRDNTSCRIFNSTPKGTANAFYRLRERGKIKRLTFHWTQHPLKSAGLYYDADGKPRSPWYDGEWDRITDSHEIAVELDIDYLGSSYPFFDHDILGNIRKNCARPPLLRAELEFDAESGDPLALERNPNGELLLWRSVGPGGKLLQKACYSVGVDVSAGTGASNSAIEVFDRATGEQVAEYANPHISAYELGRYAVALCRWLGGVGQDKPFLIWEANGHGRDFGKEVVELGYRNVHMRRREEGLRKRTSDIPGWWATREGQLSMLADFRRAMKEGAATVKSAEILNEAEQYVYQQTGWVVHSATSETLDPTGARDNHGDRVVAAALAWKGTKERPAEPVIRAAEEAPYGSVASRIRDVRDERRDARVGAW